MNKLNFTEKDILDQLDQCYKKYDFPYLENVNIDYVSGRLTGFRYQSYWAMIFDWLVWWPSGDGICLLTYKYGNCLNSGIGFNKPLYPVTLNSSWSDEVNDLIINEVKIRGIKVDDADIRVILNSDLPFENSLKLLIGLKEKYRESMLATVSEIMNDLPSQMEEVFRLDDWYHGSDALAPSQNTTFQQLAKVLVTGEQDHYQPIEMPNTDWKNWLPK